MSNTLKYYTLFAIAMLLMSVNLSTAQGFLRREGTQIVDEAGNNVILRGIGTGNWLLQEGYMMQTAGFYGTQHEFEGKLKATIGEEKTREFYDSWLSNHFTCTDVDSMAAWGFNSVRVAMHYKWFTPPVEEEENGQITWIESGFQMIDTLLSWCADNHMYLILDLHAAPGGQGKNADICDYDSTKPSLWESQANQDKTVELWKKLADRYKDETWIGGYDLINEVNWTFSEPNNAPLRRLYIAITEAIREVDKNHIIFIEGNWFANDFSGLTPPWDENMVYSFHKYWSSNDKNSLDWVLNLREQTNYPLWLGESGENSNTWFTNLISLCEEKNIGWSWWPVKKDQVNNVLKVETNPEYKQLVDLWKAGQGLSPEDTYNAVMKFSEQHRIENCMVQHDVIDAMLRQPHSTQTKAFKDHRLGKPIFAVDFDLGRNGYAYFDNDTANYSLDEDKFTAWNKGWNYRNDGVDIEKCADQQQNCGYSIGWTESGEFIQYTIDSVQEGAYSFTIRTAGKEDAAIHLEVNGKRVSKPVDIKASGAYDRWLSKTVENIILPQGECKFRIVIDEPGANLNYFQLHDPIAIEETSFELLAAETSFLENKILVHLNKAISSDSASISQARFTLIVNNSAYPVTSIETHPVHENILILETSKDLFFDDRIRLSYQGSSIVSGQQILTHFMAHAVENKLYLHHTLPGKIEAEEYFKNNGFILEECKDDDNGKNLSYANPGDYADFVIDVAKSGTYRVNTRMASEYSDGEVLLMYQSDDRMKVGVKLTFDATGGWQNWVTHKSELVLPAGKYILRLYSRKGAFNINWLSFDFITSTPRYDDKGASKLYPLPASDSVKVDFGEYGEKRLVLYNLSGMQLHDIHTNQSLYELDTSSLPNGTYILKIINGHTLESHKLQIIN